MILAGNHVRTMAASGPDGVQKPPASPLIGFESSRAGPVDTLENAMGTWISGPGQCIIDDRHARSGRHCLQLAGGPMSRVTLKLAEGVLTRGDLGFWAERWTSKKPFTFRVEQKSDRGEWMEIYNGDKAIRVGRPFLSRVRIPLQDENARQIRFTVTSPRDTGILIDDLQLSPPSPQEITEVTVEPLVLPALVGTKASPLIKLRIRTRGNRDLISLSGLEMTLEGSTDPTDILSTQVYLGTSSTFHGAPIAQSHLLGKRSTPLVLHCKGSSHQLMEGDNHIWIAAVLKEDADLDHRVGARCRRLMFSNDQQVILESRPSIQRMGLALRQAGEDGNDTYRIPGLATTNQGTLIGVYDIRHRSGGDLPGDIDVGMSRSTRGGHAWEPMKVIMDMGEDPDWHYDGIGDPAVLVDQVTNTIWVMATWSHGNRSWHGSGPGLTPGETGQLMLVRSDDDGKTWSSPINITGQVKDPSWSFLLQGPGRGITMLDGTLVFAAQFLDSPERARLPRSTIIYSRDHGLTWHIGTGALEDTTEAQVVEIKPGLLMLNCRYNRKPARVVMTTQDMGRTWQKHSSTEGALVEPIACMGSLLDAGDWLLFSNPNSTRERHRITIKASADRGLTWPGKHHLLLDEGTGAGYSCMTLIDKNTVGILYEGSQAHMTFQRIPLHDMVNNSHRQPPF